MNSEGDFADRRIQKAGSSARAGRAVVFISPTISFPLYRSKIVDAALRGAMSGILPNRGRAAAVYVKIGRV